MFEHLTHIKGIYYNVYVVRLFCLLVIRHLVVPNFLLISPPLKLP